MKIMLRDVLKEMRERKQLKQSEVADYVSISAQTYMKWENGKNEPKASDIKKLAEILNVTESEICRGKTFTTKVDELQFMKKTASIMNEIDEVTFTSTLFEFIRDKEGFLKRLENERPSKEDLFERYLAEKEKNELLAYTREEEIERQLATHEENMEKAIRKMEDDL